MTVTYLWIVLKVWDRFLLRLAYLTSGPRVWDIVVQHLFVQFLTLVMVVLTLLEEKRKETKKNVICRIEAKLEQWANFS